MSHVSYEYDFKGSHSLTAHLAQRPMRQLVESVSLPQPLSLMFRNPVPGDLGIRIPFSSFQTEVNNLHA